MPCDKLADDDQADVWWKTPEGSRGTGTHPQAHHLHHRQPPPVPPDRRHHPRR